MRNFKITLVFAILFATLTVWSVFNQLENIKNINNLQVPNTEHAIIVGWVIVSIFLAFTIYLITQSVIFFKNKEQIKLNLGGF